MKNGSKVTVILLSIIAFLCVCAGTVGLLKKNNFNFNFSNNKNNSKKEYKVTYKYYLDGIELDGVLENKTEEVEDNNFEGATKKVSIYSFEKYTCTNEVTGEWNEEEWKFVPNLTHDTTCRLYFINNTHEVTIKLSNATFADGKNENVIKVNKDSEQIVTIKPNPGYKYNSIKCENDKDITTSYLSDNNTLTIKKASKNTNCTISYGISAYKANIKVQNGSTSEDAKEANYGENITFKVSPSEGYDTPSIECTSDQKGTYSNGEFTVSAISADTTCTINFTLRKFKVTLNVENATIINANNEEHPEIQYTTIGKVSFAISNNDTTKYSMTNPDLTCDDKDVNISSTGGIISINNINKDVVCSVKLKEKPTETNPDTNAGN